MNQENLNSISISLDYEELHRVREWIDNRLQDFPHLRFVSNPLKIAFTEWISNLIKHARPQAKHLFLYSRELNHQFEFLICDDGEPFSNFQNYKNSVSEM